MEKWAIRVKRRPSRDGTVTRRFRRHCHNLDQQNKNKGRKELSLQGSLDGEERERTCHSSAALAYYVQILHALNTSPTLHLQYNSGVNHNAFRRLVLFLDNNISISDSLFPATHKKKNVSMLECWMLCCLRPREALAKRLEILACLSHRLGGEVGRPFLAAGRERGGRRHRRPRRRSYPRAEQRLAGAALDPEEAPLSGDAGAVPGVCV